MKLADVVATSSKIAATRSRLQKVDAIVDLLKRTTPDEIEVVVDYLTGVVPQGKIGVGYASVYGAGTAVTPAASATLVIAEVAAAFTRIGAVHGGGANAARARELESLFARATADEVAFLQRLLVGELRQGALEGVMVAAIAKAAEVPEASVRRAVMLSGAVGHVAAVAMQRGVAGLAEIRLQLLTPLQPMLAQTAADVDDALQALGEASIEAKLDGARVQAHRDGDEVRVFSRDGNDVTRAVPELVAVVRTLPAQKLVLDGEVIAMRPDGGPRPFQETMRRFSRKAEAPELRAAIPLTPFFFDVIHVDGSDVLDAPYHERLRALDALVPATNRVPSLVTASSEEADVFYSDAVARGFEGVMAKSLSAAYEAGRRGAGWLKVKPAHTVDLVVLAVEWGSGRRQGFLSNIHMGARDPANGGFIMLGKTFKGMTDAMLAWQTQRFLELEIGRDAHTVFVKPEQVVEVACDGVTVSTIYPGNVALRFARVKRYRDDKPAAEADTIDAIRKLLPDR